jgi:hypothetical protein
MRVRVAVQVAACALFFALASDARAEDLRDAVQRVVEAWRGVGASVVVDKTRFLDEGAEVAIALPALPAGDCTTVVLLGARGLGFHARASEEDDESKPMPSVAGALSIDQCGATVLDRLVVRSDSGRGALETIVARSTKPLPAMRDVLPERTGISVPSAPELGGLPALPPPDKRAEVAEARAKRDGASVAARETWQASADGSGVEQRDLEPGCHKLTLFALDPRAAHPHRGGKLDLDAEMRFTDSQHLLSRDRSDAPDAQLFACVGEAAHVEVVFAGAPAGSPVLVSHFAWPLPEHVPAVWGPEARARIAHVLLARHVHSVPRDPSMLVQGGGGATPVPLSVEPGGCYLAVAAVVKGVARSIGMRVRVGARVAFDERGIEGDGAAVAFCAGDLTTALAEVESRGTTLLTWGFALYRLQSGVWEQAP